MRLKKKFKKYDIMKVVEWGDVLDCTNLLGGRFL